MWKSLVELPVFYTAINKLNPSQPKYSSDFQILKEVWGKFTEKGCYLWLVEGKAAFKILSLT